MKICQNCFQEFEDVQSPETTPVEVLGEMFLQAIGGDAPRHQDAGHFCPPCREKLGIANLLGFNAS